MPATREQRSRRHIVSPRRTAQRLEQRTTQRGSSTRRGLQFFEDPPTDPSRAEQRDALNGRGAPFMGIVRECARLQTSERWTLCLYVQYLCNRG